MDPQSCTRGSARARLWLGLMIATGLLASGGPAAHAMTEARASETAAQPTLLASCDGPPESSASGPGSYRYAQTFVPEVSGTLTTAQVDIAKAPGSSGDWIMQVVLSVVLPIGAPSQQVLASTTVPDSTVPDGPSTITGSFADPATIVSGGSPRREYELVITRPGSSDIGVGYREGNDCSGVLLQSSSQAGLFTAFQGGTNDMVFKAFVLDAAAPRTRIVKGPKKRTRKRRARFKLRASEAVTRFECKLDRSRFESCGPRQKLRVEPGGHRFQARAVDLAGNVDPTPAGFRWKVLR